MKKGASYAEGEMRAQHDFSSAIKNPYAERLALGTNIVMMKPEIFGAFPSEQAENDALESLMRTGARVVSRRSALRSTQTAKTR